MRAGSPPERAQTARLAKTARCRRSPVQSTSPPLDRVEEAKTPSAPVVASSEGMPADGRTADVTLSFLDRNAPDASTPSTLDNRSHASPLILPLNSMTYVDAPDAIYRSTCCAIDRMLNRSAADNPPTNAARINISMNACEVPDTISRHASSTTPRRRIRPVSAVSRSMAGATVSCSRLTGSPSNR